MLCNKRSPHNEKSTNPNEEWPLLATTRESPDAVTNTQHNEKQIKKKLSVMDEYITVYLYSWILYNNENEWSATIDHVDEFHKHNIEQKKPDENKCIL